MKCTWKDVAFAIFIVMCFVALLFITGIGAYCLRDETLETNYVKLSPVKGLIGVNTFIERVHYNNHDYLFFVTKNGTVYSVVHDPDCECYSKELRGPC